MGEQKLEHDLFYLIKHLGSSNSLCVWFKQILCSLNDSNDEFMYARIGNVM